MTHWLRAVAWRLLGFRLLPIAAGDIVLLEVDVRRASMSAYDDLSTLLAQRGVQLYLLPKETAAITTVLQDRARRPT